MLLEAIAAERTAAKPTRRKRRRDRLKALVDKLWNYATSEGRRLSYGDYVEQLTCCSSRCPRSSENRAADIVPDGLDWPSLLKLSGEKLEAHYIRILNELSTDDMLGVVFRGRRTESGPGEAPAADSTDQR